MKATIAVLVIIGELVTGRAVQATTQAYLSGNQLYDYCLSSEVWQKALCGGYIAAVSDTSSFEAQNIGAPTRTGISNLTSQLAGTFWCQPLIPLEQLRDVVTGFLRDNPQIRNWPAPSLIALAMTKAFPCK